MCCGFPDRAIPEKYQTEDMEFPGMLKKQQMENFQGSWFQFLKLLSGITKFCGVSRWEVFFCLEFPGVK